MIIIGAGMAGLLAAQMLRRHNPEVWETQSELPNNHWALLRFRSDAVARVTGIPFERVQVNKAIFYRGDLLSRSDLRLNNMYSFKVSGKVEDRSILKLDPGERFIAPGDFIARMALGVRIKFRQSFDAACLREERTCPIISTMPMPTLMQMADWKERPEFSHRRIGTFTCHILEPECNIYQTIYYPSPEDLPYRASMTGKTLTIEVVEPDTDLKIEPGMAHELVSRTLDHFGIPEAEFGQVGFKLQHYGKITPIPADQRKEFVLAMTDLYGVYSLGRFATWRQLLLDDVVRDVEIIDSFISQRGSYQRRLRNFSKGSTVNA